MTLYEVYDICDITTEGTIGDTWKTIKEKVSNFFKELKRRLIEFGNNIIDAIKNFGNKVFKKNKSKICYVNNWDSEKIRTGKMWLDNIFRSSDKLITEVSGDGEIFSGEIIIDNVNFEPIQKRVDAIDVDFVDAGFTSTKEPDSTKKYPVPIEKIISVFKTLQKSFKDAMQKANTSLNNMSGKISQSITDMENKNEANQGPNKFLNFIFKAGTLLYKIVLLPLRGIISVLKFITGLLSNQSEQI